MFKRFVVHKVLPSLNKLLGLGRLKLVPWNAPTRDLGQFVDHLKSLGMDFKTVIDVGVAHGSPGIHDRCGKATFFLIDPVPSLKESLVKLAERLGGARSMSRRGPKTGR